MLSDRFDSPRIGPSLFSLVDYFLLTAKTMEDLDKCVEISPDILKKANAAHAANLLSRKRSYSVIADTLDEVSNKLRRRFDKMEPECDQEFQLLNRTIVNAGCIFKENQYMYDLEYKSKLRELRLRGTLTLYAKKIADLDKELLAREHKIQQQQLMLDHCKEALRNAKKREKAMECNIENLQQNNRRYESVVSAWMRDPEICVED